MDGLYVFSVWLHVLAAAVWIGGMVALGVVLVPLLRNEDLVDGGRSLFYQAALRFRWVGWGMLGVLIITGLLNLGYRGYGWSDLWTGALWTGAWGRTLAGKLLLVGVTLVVSSIHDFILGPRAIQAMKTAPNAARTERLRRWSSWLGRLTLVLSLAILWWAVALVRGGV